MFFIFRQKECKSVPSISFKFIFSIIFVKRMFQYLLGRYDFYKVVKEDSHVAIQSFNINGSLKWGKKWKIPDRIDTITEEEVHQIL